MPSFNQVILIGNMTRDPELSYTPKGSAVCKCSLAVNRRYTQNNEIKEEVTFVDFTAFGKLAENISQYVKKGRPIQIQGRLRTEEWKDNKTGQDRKKLAVIAEGAVFLGGDPRKTSGESPQDAPPQPRAAESPKTKSAPAANAGDDDEVPF